MARFRQAGDVSHDPRDEGNRISRRLLDVIVAGAAILFFLPLLLCIALAIFAEDGCPIFFSQTRLGQGGKHFQLLKFRKFGAAAGTMGLPVTLADDPRLTRVGRILEKSKLDELPQFWNVLRGDMSIVGPRPESLHFADCFVGSYGSLLSHKPGLFGPAQVLFRNESAYYSADEDPERTYRRVLFPTKASLDLQHYTRRSLLEDLAWIALGVAAVVGFSPARLVKQPVWPGRPASFSPASPAMIDLRFAGGPGMASVVEESSDEL